MVESDDEHESSHYPSRTNRGGEIDTTIYDLEEDTWTDDDTSMLAGASTSLDEAGLRAILKNDLTYLKYADAYTLGTTPSIRSLDRCSWTNDGCQEE